MEIRGGTLQPQPFNGQPVDVVYGVGQDGSYLGLVPAASASQVATYAPPRPGNWKWADGQWVRRRGRDELVAEIEAERDSRLAAGVVWGGHSWYADDTFQQQITSYVSAFQAGVIDAGSTVPVRAKDKVVYQLTSDDVMSLSAALLTFVQGVWQWSWDQKAAIQE